MSNPGSKKETALEQFKRYRTQFFADKNFRRRLVVHARNAWHSVLGRFRSHPLSIVSGADASHGKSLIQFVKSVLRYEPRVRLFIYDLGLTHQQRAEIEQIAPYATIRSFDYARYPAWFDIRVNAGQYAWKPVIVEEVVRESPGPVIWMDAGNRLTGKLGQIYVRTMRDGVYSPSSNGEMKDWTHELMLAHFQLGSEWVRGKRNVNGACIAFSPLHQKGMALCREWSKWAQIQPVIAPPGSSRDNHRQDQALLGVLAHRARLISNDVEFCVGFKTHCDID